jgi:Na+-transporting methylmalonyl-CoA/oxaloacetate decarboxylase gamma subunit
MSLLGRLVARQKKEIQSVTQMGQGIMLTIIGMGTVFVSLIALAMLIRALDKLATIWESGSFLSRKTSLKVAATPLGLYGGEELLPVIMVAVNTYLESQGTQVFLVDVERPDQSGWTMEGRVSALSGSDVYPGGDRI